MRIIVTGASKGIGFQLAEALGKAGHQVFGFSRSTVESTRFISVSVDVTDLNQIRNAVEKITTEYGSIEILINNAGVGMVGPIENTIKEDIHKLIDVNVVGVVQMISAVLPQMRGNKFGRILNISSIGSEMGLPFRGFYSASKSAIDKITEALRYEVRPWHIEAAALHLGDIKTDIAEGRLHTEVSDHYQAVFDRVYTSMNEEVNQGSEPDAVAKYVLKLLRKRHWKAHYYFGKTGQKIAIPLKWLLPQTFYEYLMRKYSGIK